MPRGNPMGYLAGQGKSIAKAVAKNPGKSAIVGLGAAAIAKRRGPGVSRRFANGKRSTSIYKY